MVRTLSIRLEGMANMSVEIQKEDTFYSVVTKHVPSNCWSNKRIRIVYMGRILPLQSTILSLIPSGSVVQCVLSNFVDDIPQHIPQEVCDSNLKDLVEELQRREFTEYVHQYNVATEEGRRSACSLYASSLQCAGSFICMFSLGLVFGPFNVLWLQQSLHPQQRYLLLLGIFINCNVALYYLPFKFKYEYQFSPASVELHNTF